MAAAPPPSPDIVLLYSDHHGWLVGWLRRRLGNPCDAADLAHDTFVRVPGKPQALHGVREPRAWLSTIAHGLVVDHTRRAALKRACLDAIGWAVRLASGLATDTDRAACEAWRRSHAMHELAWEHVQAIETQFTLPTSQRRLAHGVLQAVGPRQERGRRQGGRAVECAGGLGEEPARAGGAKP